MIQKRQQDQPLNYKDFQLSAEDDNPTDVDFTLTLLFSFMKENYKIVILQNRLEINSQLNLKLIFVTLKK